MLAASLGDSSKTDIRELYDSLAGEKQDDKWISKGDRVRLPETRSGNYFLDRKLRTALSLAHLEPGARVLEVGCQYGFFAFRLADLGFDVTAVDLSAAAIQVAEMRRQKFAVPNIRFLTSDAEHLAELEADSFAAVFSFSCLRYLEDATPALQQMRRVLRPGGRLVVDFPNRHSPWFRAIKTLIRYRPHIHDHLYSARQVRRLIEQAGFTAAETRHILYTPRRCPDVTLPFFKACDTILEPTPLKHLAAIVMGAGTK
jgi:ubiquinone/menaquinone biosynthesis C-methylase UbiE